jgi:hypothetical protein
MTVVCLHSKYTVCFGVLEIKAPDQREALSIGFCDEGVFGKQLINMFAGGQA